MTMSKRDEKGNKKKFKIIFTLLITNLAVSAYLILYLFVFTGTQPSHDGTIVFEQAEKGQYVLYIGTNDKDTYEQTIPTEEAREIVNNICLKYVEGYTTNDAKGGWVNEKGILTQENTLVYSFLYADEKSIISIMDEVLTALNQKSILVERRDVESVLYYGKGVEQ